MNTIYLSASEIKDLYRITSQTLHNWRLNGHIKFTRLPSGKIVYEPITDAKNNRVSVVYARVSNTKQKGDLDRQITVITEYAVKNGHKIDQVFSDIASGMNEDRKSFNSMLDLVCNNQIDTIFVSYKDRLTRFGFNYIENLCSRFGTKVEVVNLTREEDFQTELVQDLISIIHHFSMKMYSNRRKELKKTKNYLEKERGSV